MTSSLETQFPSPPAGGDGVARPQICDSDHRVLHARGLFSDDPLMSEEPQRSSEFLYMLGRGPGQDEGRPPIREVVLLLVVDMR